MSSSDILVFLLAFLNIFVVRADPCAEFKTCAQCIGNALKCVWCPDPNYNKTRCASSSLVPKTSKEPWCYSPINPQKQKPKTTKNEEFRSKKEGQSAIQLKPQKIYMKARPGDTIEFELHYRPAEDYPIDIYYLFDNSYTMRLHKAKLVEQAHAMKIKLEKMSNNVRFGAGSFVEKLAMPYASEAVGHKLNSFNNHVSLTEDIAQFVQIVEKVNYTSNYDDPESGLDGLMQVMVCGKEIKWREQARRMIIYLTDATYHSAGDGKIVGAYKPNDRKCHLVEPTPKDDHTSHVYDKEAALTYDYPSVSQISKVASEGKFGIYFTTLENVTNEYKALAERINAHYFKLKNISTSDDTGSDLVAFISDEYRKLVQNTAFEHNVPPHVEMTLVPDCNEKVPCEIGYKKTKSLNGTIHVKNCPSENKLTDTIEIWPSGLEETLNIQLEVVCQCECEKKGNGEKNSTKCSHNGTYQCGICKCNNNRYGKMCECEGTSSEERDEKLCTGSAKNGVLCSGHGKCSCGKCVCKDGYDGAQCQFRTNLCPTFENEVCGNHGKCEQNKCKCYPGYTGFDCTCSTATDMCVGANSEICSGNGNCKCGECACTKIDKSNNLYRGKYCDSCDTCIDDRCKELGDYVKCNYDGEQSKCDKSFQIKNKRTVKIKNQTDMNDWAGNRCVKELDDQSSIVFKYLDGNNATVIWIQKEKELPSEINKWVAFGSAIGVILLIGILTLIAWKIFVDIYDSREYRKFVEESTAAGFEVSENPLYNPPQISINNPAYMG